MKNKKKFENFKPDFGFFFKEQFGESIKYHFYSVSMFEIIHVGHNLFSFTSITTYADKEYAVTFDFTVDKLKHILNSLPNSTDAQRLSSILIKPFEQPEKVELVGNQIKVDVTATLGQPVKSLYEEFIPFIVEEISNVNQSDNKIKNNVDTDKEQDSESESTNHSQKPPQSNQKQETDEKVR